MVGAVDFKAGDETYTLQFDTNALCRIEEASGQNAGDFIEAFSRGVSVKDMRLLVWAGLLKKHEVTVEAAGDIMDAAGGLSGMAEIIQKGLSSSMPEETGGKKTKARG